MKFAVNVFFSSGINHEHASANRIRNVNIAVGVDRDPLRMLKSVLLEGKQRRSLPVKLVYELAAGIGDVDVTEKMARK